MKKEPREIYQRNCDAIARALWDRDFETIRAHTALPVRMITPDADVTISDKNALHQGMEELRESLSRLGATAFLRICKTAEFAPGDETRILGSHTSYVLRGATNLLPPYDSRMLMVREADGWKASDIFSHVSNRHMTVISPEIAIAHRTHKE